MLLRSVAELGDKAYAVTIGRKVGEHRKALPAGQVYAAMARLRRLGYVTSRIESKKRHRRRGPPRRYYRVSALGREVMAETGMGEGKGAGA